MSQLSDHELRLECARLAAVFSGGNDLGVNAAKLYAFMREEQAQAAEQSFCPHCGHDLRAERELVVGEAQFDPRGEFRVAGQLVDVTPTERLLAETLLRARGGFVDRHLLAERLGFDGVDPSNMVRVYVTRLRDALARAGAPRELVEGSYGRGYRWNSSVKAVAEAA